MTSLSHIEQRIFEVDGIRASLSGPDTGHAEYWTNRFNGGKKLMEFKSRFSQRYPRVEIVVYDGIGRIAHGSYLLRNLRATHEFGWIQETVDLYALLIVDQKAQIESLKQLLAQAAQAGAVAQAEPDSYEILGVDRSSTDEQIKQAYQRKISRFHPDKLSGLDEAIIKFGNERAQLINRARDDLLEERVEAKAA